MTMPTFRHEGIAFHFLDAGDGIPFIYQHGLGGDVCQPLDLFAEPFPFRLLSLDCRGHGQTQPLSDVANLTFRVFADDVSAWLDHLKIEKVVMGGGSMGAGVALAFALAYPERLLGLVLSRPAWLDQAAPANLRVFQQIARLIQEHGATRGRQRFLASESYRAMAASSPINAASLRDQFARPRIEERWVVLDRLPNDAPTTDRAAWATIQTPTLVVVNDQDPVHPRAFGETLAAAMPAAELVTITPKGIDQRQHATELDAAVRRFIATRCSSERTVSPSGAV